MHEKMSEYMCNTYVQDTVIGTQESTPVCKYKTWIIDGTCPTLA